MATTFSVLSTATVAAATGLTLWFTLHRSEDLIPQSLTILLCLQFTLLLEIMTEVEMIRISFQFCSYA